MLKRKCPSFIFCRNCLIAYVLVGFSSAFIAESYQNFQLSNQLDDNDYFARLISLGAAYSVKENLYK